MTFEQTGSQEVWKGKMIRVGVQRYRHDDGEEVTREKVWHPGAVAILALDATHVWLTRQPREVIGATASLEVPAGKLDVQDEPPLQTAQRELAEEIGKRAQRWEAILGFYTSAGFSDERIQLYFATELSDAGEVAPAQENERIEVIPWPLRRLDEAITQCEDAKSLIALLWLKQSGRAVAGQAE